MLCLGGKTELETPIIVKRAEYKGAQITNSLKTSNTVYFKNYDICKSPFQETEVLNMSSNF